VAGFVPYPDVGFSFDDATDQRFTGLLVDEQFPNAVVRYLER
jgi:hypothetical protein